MEEQREKTKKHGAGFAVRIIILTAAAAVFCYAAFQLYSIYHELGKLGAFDINYRDTVWHGDKEKAAEAVRGILPYIDLLKISEEEVDMVGGEEKLFDTMKEYSIAAVIETLGADGAKCFFDGQVLEVAGRSAHGQDRPGPEHCGKYGFSPEASRCPVLAGNVKGTADEPSDRGGSGHQGTEYPYRTADR